jgi:adenosylmethionine-8-amino-7-oxononanoate aminotransferase
MNLATLDRNHIWHPFTQEKSFKEPIVITKGEGAYLYDDKGRRYLDAISSWWTNLHGHSHPKIAAAIAAQALKLEHVIFAGFSHEPAIKLSERLVNLLNEGHAKESDRLTRVFYSDNGSTSVEIALKIAYQYWQNKGQTRKKFMSFKAGYHGDTFGAMAVGKSSGFYKNFESLLFDVDFFPFPATWDGDGEVEAKEEAALEEIESYILKNKSEIAGLIIEPLVQGAGGLNMSREVFLQRLVELCKAHEVLVIFDEVMTGFGRTGELFACKKANAFPDLICLAKGITGGFLPLAATVVREEIYEAFLGNNFDNAFAHGHSYTANPIGCAAALASLDLLVSDKTFEQLKMIESVHRSSLQSLSDTCGIVAKKRVTGTIAAFNLGEDQSYGSFLQEQLKNKFLELGVIIRPLGNIIHIMPPYCISKNELEHVYSVIESIIGE